MERMQYEQQQRDGGAPGLKLCLWAALADAAWCLLLWAAPSLALFVSPLVAAFAAAALARQGRSFSAAALLALLPLFAPAAVLLFGGAAAAALGALALPAAVCAVWYVQTRRLGGFPHGLGGGGGRHCGAVRGGLPAGHRGRHGRVHRGAGGGAPAGRGGWRRSLRCLPASRGYAESAAIAEQLFSSMYLAVPVLLTGVLCVLGALFGFFTAVLFFAFTRRRRAACGLAAPKPFRLWVIPRRYVPGIVLLYVMALVLRLSGFANADAVYNTVGSLLNLPLMVQGLSLVAFLLSLRSRPGKALSAVTYVLIGVLFPLTSSMLTTVGLFDLFLRFRDRAIPPAAPQRGE